jgi:hypothetical protein
VPRRKQDGQFVDKAPAAVHLNGKIETFLLNGSKERGKLVQIRFAFGQPGIAGKWTEAA